MWVQGFGCRRFRVREGLPDQTKVHQGMLRYVSGTF